MAKRTEKQIILGSGKLYLVTFTDAMPEVEDICKEENQIGLIKGGASIEYTEETYTETDDLNLVQKIITTNEEAKLKCGLITWNGKSLEKLLARCKSTEANGRRVTKIGGVGNEQGGYYAICFFHEDKVDGNVWVAIKGRNTAGASFSFGTDAGSKLEPEFSALPHDNAGTLIEFVEEIDKAA